MNKMIQVCAISAVLGGAGYAFASDLTTREQAIADRLSPMGQVHVAGESDATTEDAVEISVSPDEAFYNGLPCSACHAAGVAGAPIVGNADDWAPRIANAREQVEALGVDDYIDVLAHFAIEGIGAMPPRGTCANCSDEDIHRAVTYMVEQSQ